MCVDVVDTEYKRLEQCLNRLLRQDAEFIVGIEPVAFLALAAGLTDMLVGTEIPVHRAIPQIHARHHQHSRIGEGFDNPPSHVRLRQ